MTELDFSTEEALFAVSTPYQYLIIARDTESDFSRTLVYKQLMEIKRKLRENEFVVKVVTPLNNVIGHFHRFYFLIRILDGTLDKVADHMNLRIYNFDKHYVDSFMRTNARQFKRFRDFHIHQIILHILNSEFNVEHFKKRGIIEDHFPVHRFPAMRNIHGQWKTSGWAIYFQSFRKNTQPTDLRPFHSIAFYYGCTYGFYMAFNTVYISWLIFIALIGLAFILRTFAMQIPFDNFLTPIYAFIITLWVTIVFERWKQREKELAFVWNTLKFKLNETPRIDYIGHYTIDSTSKEISEQKNISWLIKFLVG